MMRWPEDSMAWADAILLACILLMFADLLRMVLS